MVYGAALVLMDVAVAHRYGTGVQAATYQAAYLIPTILFSIFSSGAIQGAFIPIFIRLGGQRLSVEAQQFLMTSALAVLAVLLTLSVILMAGAEMLSTLVASGFDPEHQEQLTRVIRLMLPMLVFHGIASVFGAALIAKSRVGVANLATALIPLAGLCTYPWWEEGNGASMIAIAYVVGAGLYALILGVSLRLLGSPIFTTMVGGSQDTRIFMRVYVMAAFSHAAMSALLLINQSLAGSLTVQELAAFSYGIKLVLLALAFFTTVASNVILPHFSNIATQQEHHKIWLSARQLILRAGLVTGFVAFAWICVTEWVVEILYARGQFTLDDVSLVSSVQRIFLLQAPFYVVGVICWRIINALGKWKPLAVASLLALVLDVILAPYLARHSGVTGIAAAHSLAIVAWSMALLFASRFQLTSSNSSSHGIESTKQEW